MIRDITIGQYYPVEICDPQNGPENQVIWNADLHYFRIPVPQLWLGYAVATLFLAGMITISQVPVKFIFQGTQSDLHDPSDHDGVQYPSDTG